jgi:DNA-binding NtrC family response regulator
MNLNFHQCKDEFEKAYIEKVLRICGGQINVTSRRTGLNKVSLADKIKKHQIDWKQIRVDVLGPALREASAS